MKRTLVLVCSVGLIASASRASAQLTSAGPVVYGHHHLNTTNMAAQKRFFVDTLGGTLITVGTNNAEVVKFPNVLIFFRPAQAPTGGTRGTTVNHIGFSVPSLRPAIDRIKANGFQMITNTEATGREVKDDIAGPLQPGGASIAFAQGPDDVKVELVEVKQQTIPITLHHVHFFNPKNVEMRDWYVKTFGAAAGTAGPPFAVANLPGVVLNFTPSADPVAGTAGRALDHIGFEIKNLEAFTKKLEADGIKLAVPYRQVPALGIAVAFFTDPWGTYIELTEGLDKIK
jgi:catechol 2,3-dioxygenase-like lactoylglutathione lyase family enzyme